MNPYSHSPRQCPIHIPPGKHSDVPPFPIERVRERLGFLCLLTSPEAIKVMEHVRVECEKVCGMTLFHTGVSKHLKLEEFEQTQQQASTQVSH